MTTLREFMKSALLAIAIGLVLGILLADWAVEDAPAVKGERL